MSGNTRKMKYEADLDNSKFVKSSREMKQQMRDFSSASSDAMSALGSAFGVNVGEIERMTSALQGMGQRFTQSGDEGVQALGKVITSLGGVTTALAGIGIAAAVAGFRMLQDEAENFRSTVAGANMEMATAAYIDTYRQVLHDFNGDVGKTMAETESKFKKFWGTLGANAKTALLTGAWSGDNTGGQNAYYQMTGAAAEKAKKAEEISNRIYEINRKIAKESVTWAEQEAQIAAAREKGDNATALSLINDRYGSEIALQKQLVDLKAQMLDLASNTVAAEDDLYAAQLKLNKLSEQQANLTRRIGSSVKGSSSSVDWNSVASVAASSAASIAAADAEVNAMGDQIYESFRVANGLAALPQELQDIADAAYDVAIATGDALKLDSQIIDDSIVWAKQLSNGLLDEFENMNAEAERLGQEFSMAISSGFSSGMQVLMDSLMGLDELNGGAIMQALLSPLADLAIKEGEIVMAAGIANTALFASLTDPSKAPLAIAAGAALIAVGSAAKSGLSALANSYGASSSSVASGGYSTASSGNYDSSEVKVVVTGTLRGQGSQLVAVIENENKRTNRTT